MICQSSRMLQQFFFAIIPLLPTPENTILFACEINSTARIKLSSNFSQASFNSAISFSKTSRAIARISMLSIKSILYYIFRLIFRSYPLSLNVCRKMVASPTRVEHSYRQLNVATSLQLPDENQVCKLFQIQG